jgi:hypothetical protein
MVPTIGNLEAMNITPSDTLAKLVDSLNEADRRKAAAERAKVAAFNGPRLQQRLALTTARYMANRHRPEAVMKYIMDDRTRRRLAKAARRSAT